MFRPAAVLTLASGLWACAPAVEPPPTAEEIQASPLRVATGVEGRFAAGRAWTLHLEGDGRAAVLLQRGPVADGSRGLEPETKALELTFEDLEALRAVLAEQGFFELPTRLGRGADDHGSTWIEVRSGARSHRVELLYVHPREMLAGSNGVRGTLQDVARAQAVFDAVAVHLPADWAAARSPAWERALEERKR